MSDYRVRRPGDKEALISRLTTGDAKVFPTIKDLLVFAAALGRSETRRTPLASAGSDPVRLDTFVRGSSVEYFIFALAIAAAPDDPEIVSEERTPDRIKIFEEFANGGLEVLQGMLNARPHLSEDDAISSIVSDATRTAQANEAPDITAFADELGL